MSLRFVLLGALLAVLPLAAHAQVDAPDEAPVGAWYMYFGTATFGASPFGAHAEVQVRNHDIASDLQQLLIRTSARYTLPDRSATLSLGYGYVLSEAEGQPDNPFNEHRIYQEAALPQRVSVVRLNHRFRYEQRFVDDADFQTRYRYALFATVPLNRSDLDRGAVYAATYAEIFLRGAGRGDRPVFDRSRLYGALGYKLTDGLGVQAGYMEQGFETGTDGQLQLSLHHALSL